MMPTLPVNANEAKCSLCSQNPRPLPQVTPLLYNEAAVKIPEGVIMASLVGLAGFVSELKATRTNLVSELRHVDAALSVLGKLHGGSSYAKPRRTMSAAARRKISLAQKARWAKAKGRALKPKRTMSAAGRKRIAAAQRARWAKIRAGKKAG
jgi:hypothetical protein